MPRFRPGLVVSVSAALALGASLGFGAPRTFAPGASPARLLRPTDSTRAPLVRVARAAFGLSGALRMAFVDPMQPVDLPLVWNGEAPAPLSYQWEPVAGTTGTRLLGEPLTGSGLQAPAGSGAWRLSLRGEGWSQEVGDLTVVTRVPFHEKRDGYLNGYRIGRWPTEGSGRTDRYAPPAGFIEVTPENQELRVSEHFRLGSFLTKNQRSVWPKYLALDLRLIDKLELVMQELASAGVRAERMAVMSGFRTPAYNAEGVGEGGRALLSRHTYGDASDVWVDNDGDGYMDDLNGDGRRDTRDAEVMRQAVDRVEAKYPELVGGCGVYRDNGAHGPFVHIDARGYRARW